MSSNWGRRAMGIKIHMRLPACRLFYGLKSPLQSMSKVPPSRVVSAVAALSFHDVHRKANAKHRHYDAVNRM